MIEREQIIAMAVKAGFVENLGNVFGGHRDLERFAALVAEKERESCAKVAEDMDAAVLAMLNFTRQPIAIAAAIRSRGETK